MKRRHTAMIENLHSKRLRSLWCAHEWHCQHSEGYAQQDNSVQGLDDLYCSKCGKERIKYWRIPPMKHSVASILCVVFGAGFTLCMAVIVAHYLLKLI